MKMFFLGMLVAYTPSLIILAWVLRKRSAEAIANEMD
jgi:hypothetical protein